MIFSPFLIFTVHSFGHKKTVITGYYLSANCYGFLIPRAKTLSCGFKPLNSFQMVFFLLPPFLIFWADAFSPESYKMVYSGSKFQPIFDERRK